MKIEDIVEIQQLQALYGHAVDHHDQSMLGLVFTEDAVFDARPAGGEDQLHQGLAAISAWFGLGKPPHPVSHHMTNVWVYEQDGQVRARSKWMIRGLDGQMYSGDYEDLLQRTEQGWRIKHRMASLRLPSDA